MYPSMESTIGLSRRFLNLIVGNGISGVKSLCCIDLTQQSLFNPTTPPQPSNGTGSQQGPQDYAIPRTHTGNEKNKQAAAAALMMEQLRVPSSSLTFRASASTPNDQVKIDCFPLVGSKVICADQLGHAFRFDAETGYAWTMPSLHKPKSMPLSLFVPNADADNDFQYGSNPRGSSLFVMEKIPKSEVGCSTPHSDQFEVFVYRKPMSAVYIKAWHCQLLPPPPYVREPKYQDSCLEISSYTVLGSDICIAVNGVGTYRSSLFARLISHQPAVLQSHNKSAPATSHKPASSTSVSQQISTSHQLPANRTGWKEVGKWSLPFHGRVEYVPELKLWFGLSAESQHLAAADLSSLDSQPQLLGPWKELELPEEWKECRDTQLVHLGSGKFCIARFFQTTTPGGHGSSGKNFAVLTGVEVVPCVYDVNGNGNNGKAELRMIPHKSKRVDGASIEALF